MDLKIGHRISNVFKRIPLFGVIGHTGKAANKEAAIEMITTVMFSTLPIWFGGLIIAINKFFIILPNNDRCIQKLLVTYINSLYTTISNAELLMYAAATLGPILYLALAGHRNNSKQPWLRLQITIAIITNLLATVLFFHAREKGYAGDLGFVNFTIFIYAFTLILLYPAMAIDHQHRANPTAIQREELEDFMAGYRERKERSK